MFRLKSKIYDMLLATRYDREQTCRWFHWITVGAVAVRCVTLVRTRESKYLFSYRGWQRSVTTQLLGAQFLVSLEGGTHPHRLVRQLSSSHINRLKCNNSILKLHKFGMGSSLHKKIGIFCEKFRLRNLYVHDKTQPVCLCDCLHSLLLDHVVMCK